MPLKKAQDFPASYGDAAELDETLDLEAVADERHELEKRLIPT